MTKMKLKDWKPGEIIFDAFLPQDAVEKLEKYLLGYAVLGKVIPDNAVFVEVSVSVRYGTVSGGNEGQNG